MYSKLLFDNRSAHFVREQRLDLLWLLTRFDQLLLHLHCILALRERLSLRQEVRQQDLHASKRRADRASEM